MEPILITFVRENKLHFSLDIFKDILSTVGSRPVSVVSVSYPDGHKKNEVFNEILKYLDTLKVNKKEKEIKLWKSKTNADPKGIYLWPEAIVMRKSCEEVAVILMEINGCFDPKKVKREDLMLYAMSCVLSSTLICSSEYDFSNEMQEFVQLFEKYGKGGISPQMNESFFNLVLMINNWKYAKRYPFGFHDSSTCPLNGKKMSNYRRDRLDTILSVDKSLEEKIARRNKFFVHCFQKVTFCLMPGEDSPIDQNSNITEFNDIWYHIIIRLFHPSNLSLKRLSHRKLNGNHLIRLFEQISLLMSETNPQMISEEHFRYQLENITKELAESVYNLVEKNELDNKISQLFGICLKGLTDSVRYAIDTN